MAYLDTIRRLTPCSGGPLPLRRFMKRLNLQMLAAGFFPLLLLCTTFANAGEHGNHRSTQQQETERGAQSARKNQPHLAEWFRNHQNLTPEQQIQAIQKEPGFNRLPIPQQLRLQKQLYQLSILPPAQRERTLQHMEALEKLSPDQRQQIGRMMQQVGSMPPDQQRRMRQAFRFLRDLPPDQRQAILASAPFKSQFSAQENEILTKLMSLEPYVPPNPAGK